MRSFPLVMQNEKTAPLAIIFRPDQESPDKPLETFYLEFILL
jgi:hypothetical protein